MDKAAIFTAIVRRNALRRANGLPTIDVRAEYARQVALAIQQDYHARCEKHAAEREVIRLEALAELRAKHGTNFGHTMGGRWAIGELTRKRFKAFMELKYGTPRPEISPALNLVTFGEHQAEASD
jgi:hypothetical protein